MIVGYDTHKKLECQISLAETLRKSSHLFVVMAGRRPSSIDLKIVILGSASVGKTSIINRYCNGSFQEDTIATVGAGFFTHTVMLDETEVTLMIWDTAGEERFRSVAPSLLRGASGLILAYDVTSKESFDDLDIYIEMFLDTVNVNIDRELPVLLLANKCDLNEMDRVVDNMTVEEWKKKNKIKTFANVSAKTGQGIENAFDEFVRYLITPEHFQDAPTLQYDVMRRSSSASDMCNC